jgi:hypothetical protein
MEETTRLIISMRRVSQATSNALRAVTKEIEADDNSAYHKLFPPLRALHKHMYGSWQREVHANMGDLSGGSITEHIWDPYLAALSYVKCAKPKRPELETLNEHLVSSWKKFDEAASKKAQASSAQGVCFELLVSGQMLSLPLESSTGDPGVRIVKMSQDNPASAIRLDKSAVKSGRLPRIVVEFVMGALWTTRGNQSRDYEPILIDVQSLENTRKGLAERLQFLLSRAKSGRAGPRACVQDIEPETAHQGSFLGLALPIPIKEQNDGLPLSLHQRPTRLHKVQSISSRRSGSLALRS